MHDWFATYPVPMTVNAPDSEVVALRKLASHMAESRRESLSSAHLLVAIASSTSPAADLLRERKLDVETLTRLARASSENGRDHLAHAMRRASAVAKTAGNQEPNALHLLIALLKDTQSAAYRALRQSGIDMARLQATATGLASGLVEPRRVVSTDPPQPYQVRNSNRFYDKYHRPVPEQGQRRVRSAFGAANGSTTELPFSLQHPGGGGFGTTTTATTTGGTGMNGVPTTGAIAASAPSSLSPNPSTRPSGAPGVVVPIFPPKLPTPRIDSTVDTSRNVPTSASANLDSSAPPAHTSPPAKPKTPAAVARKLPRQHRLAYPKAKHGSAAAPTPSVVSPSSSLDNEAQRSTLALDARAFPMLSATAVNLSVTAVQGQLNAIVERDTEMEQLLDVLAKQRANGALLIGAAGVGKSSIARGIAVHLLQQQHRQDHRIVVELSAGQILAQGLGAATQQLTAICKETLSARGTIILVVDDGFALLTSEAFDACAEMKGALSSGKLPLVATCSTDEFRRLTESHPAIAKCFTPVDVEEPNEQRAVQMLMHVRDNLQQHHNLVIDDTAVRQTVSWATRYLCGRALPDKAVHVLDLAGARGQRRGLEQVGPAMVAEIVAEMADMPVQRLMQTDSDRLLALEQLLSDQVVGHNEQLARIATILRRNAVGLRSQRPIGTFLLLGPTGVGKTETAKAIANALFHRPSAMTRLDLSEFAEPHALARLVGAPPGYVGHEAGGQLTESVRRKPYQVLLLDEFEKAHRDVQQAFLQVFDEGRMTDGRGRTVDFSNTVIVMTSNIGAMQAQQASQSRTIGFGSQSEDRTGIVREAVISAARTALSPELYNRIDEVLFFAPLLRDQVRQVARKVLSGLSERVQQAQGLRLTWTEAGIDALLDAGGYEPTLGARPVKRTIARFVEAPLAELILRKQAEQGQQVQVDADDHGKVALRVKQEEN